MPKEPVYHDSKVCPECFSTIMGFGRPSLKPWRCCDPTCTNSKEHDWFLIEDELIERNRVKIEVF